MSGMEREQQQQLKEKCCDGKWSWATLDSAKKAAWESHYAYGGAFRAYECGFCGSYHTGHPPRPGRKAGTQHTATWQQKGGART